MSMRVAEAVKRRFGYVPVSRTGTNISSIIWDFKWLIIFAPILGVIFFIPIVVCGFICLVLESQDKIREWKVSKRTNILITTIHGVRTHR